MPLSGELSRLEILQRFIFSVLELLFSWCRDSFRELFFTRKHPTMLARTLFLVLVLALPTVLSAQFHQKKSTGGSYPGVRQMNNTLDFTNQGYSGGNNMHGQAVAPPQAQMQGGGAVNSREMAAIVLSDEAKQLAREAGVNMQIGYTDLRDAEVWGRAENHTDGTYTETVIDDSGDADRQKDQNVITQRTRRRITDFDNPNAPTEDPVIMTRKIYLNQIGRPDHVRIYDAADRYKYMGKFVYDPLGRMVEQHLRDAQGKPLRRVIQDYDAQGQPLPLKNVDYVKDIPRDLQLMVTSGHNHAETQALELENEARKGKLLIGPKKKNQQQNRPQIGGGKRFMFKKKNR